jgi:hypothetical protein
MDNETKEYIDNKLLVIERELDGSLVSIESNFLLLSLDKLNHPDTRYDVIRITHAISQINKDIIKSNNPIPLAKEFFNSQIDILCKKYEMTTDFLKE